MNRKIKNCLALSAILVSSLGAVEPGSKITVFVYNYAAVSPQVLAGSVTAAAAFVLSKSARAAGCCSIRGGRLVIGRFRAAPNKQPQHRTQHDNFRQNVNPSVFLPDANARDGLPPATIIL